MRAFTCLGTGYPIRWVTGGYFRGADIKGYPSFVCRNIEIYFYE